MINKKGRGEGEYGHQTAIGLRRVAGMVVVTGAVIGVWFFAGAGEAEAAR